MATVILNRPPVRVRWELQPRSSEMYSNPTSWTVNVVERISCNRQNKAKFISEIHSVFARIRRKKCVLAFALVFLQYGTDQESSVKCRFRSGYEWLNLDLICVLSRWKVAGKHSWNQNFYQFLSFLTSMAILFVSTHVEDGEIMTKRVGWCFFMRGGTQALKIHSLQNSISPVDDRKVSIVSMMNCMDEWIIGDPSRAFATCHSSVQSRKM